MKAILVIDIPDEYAERYNVNQMYVWSLTVQDKRGYEMFDLTTDKPSHLKPLPQKLEVKVDTFDDIMHTEFQMTDVIADKFIANIRFETDKLVALGWNACLDEITGEEE